jgi:hypothetical protein
MCGSELKVYEAYRVQSVQMCTRTQTEKRVRGAEDRRGRESIRRRHVQPGDNTPVRGREWVGRRRCISLPAPVATRPSLSCNDPDDPMPCHLMLMSISCVMPDDCGETCVERATQRQCCTSFRAAARLRACLALVSPPQPIPQPISPILFISLHPSTHPPTRAAARRLCLEIDRLHLAPSSHHRPHPQRVSSAACPCLLHLPARVPFPVPLGPSIPLLHPNAQRSTENGIDDAEQSWVKGKGEGVQEERGKTNKVTGMSHQYMY